MRETYYSPYCTWFSLHLPTPTLTNDVPSLVSMKKSVETLFTDNREVLDFIYNVFPTQDFLRFLNSPMISVSSAATDIFSNSCLFTLDQKGKQIT